MQICKYQETETHTCYMNRRNTLKMLLLCTGLAVFSSCLERSFIEENGTISSPETAVVVPSDRYEGRNLVKDTVYITSNRSWSAAVVEDADWISLSREGFLNLACQSEVTPLELSFTDNESDEARTATIHVTCESGDQDITVTQEAISYRIAVTSDLTPFSTTSGEGDTLRLTFNTNTAWALRVRDDASAQVLLIRDPETGEAASSVEGKYSGEVAVVIMENEDLETKAATLVLSATGCEDIEIPLTQAKGFPYVRIVEGGNVCEADPGRPDEVIPIKSNVPWTAEVVSVEGYGEGEVSVQPSGEKGVQNVKVTFPYCIDFEKVGRIVVRISGEGVETPLEYTITQQPCVRIMWYDYKNEELVGATAATYPFTTPPLSDIATASTSVKAAYKMNEFDLVTKRGGFVFKMYSTPGIWRNGATGLMFGTSKGDYLALPAIEGHRLVRIVYGMGCTRSSNNTLNLRVEDPAGNAIEGGTILYAPKNLPVVLTYDLSGTEPGVAYRIVQQSAVNYALGDLILFYD